MSKPRRQKRDISGWLILNKPFGMSSAEAVGKVRWLFNAAKAGHAGTLDPLATGVLPIALGEATKTVPQVQDGTKIYRFRLKWGEATSTDDAEGKTVATSDYRPGREEIEKALPGFTGLITQVPPAFSAIRIGGERAYDLARAGGKPDMPPREVAIDRFTLLAHGKDASDFEVECQKGTYIRALARDLAEALGTRGHVANLHRARVGSFADEKAVNLADLEAALPEARDTLLLPVAAALRDVPEIRLDAQQAALIRLGNPVLLTGAGAPIAVAGAWASHAGKAIAIGSVEKGRFKPRRVILPK